MVERRQVIGTAVVAGLSGVFASRPREASAADADSARVASAISSLPSSIGRQFSATQVSASPYVARVRMIQRTYLQSTHRYPAFLEVGLAVWDEIYDWHVLYQRPIDARQLGDGRYVMTFMFTTLILRPDQAADFISAPLDVA